jgi:hypothetical protein
MFDNNTKCRVTEYLSIFCWILTKNRRSKMNKVIGVQRGLNELAQTLENEGYIVTDMFDDAQPVSAVIYTAQEGEETDKTLSMDIASEGKGVMMINALDKNVNEIIDMLKDL